MQSTDHVTFGGEDLICDALNCHPLDGQRSRSILGSVVLLFLGESRQTEVRHFHHAVPINPVKFQVPTIITCRVP